MQQKVINIFGALCWLVFFLKVTPTLTALPNRQSRRSHPQSVGEALKQPLANRLGKGHAHLSTSLRNFDNGQPAPTKLCPGNGRENGSYTAMRELNEA